jgi:hypothetical protein
MADHIVLVCISYELMDERIAATPKIRDNGNNSLPRTSLKWKLAAPKILLVVEGTEFGD